MFGSDCERCGKQAQKEQQLMERGASIKEAKDFKSWEMADMTELFWIHLGLYQWEPNRESLVIMRAAMNWAAHASYRLHSSFRDALEWAGIKNLYVEIRKWDSAEKGEQP